MITDSIRNVERYQGLSERLDRVFRFIEETDLGALPPGRTDIDGDTVYVNHILYTTAPQKESDLYEAHMRYLDLHLILSGHEAVSVAPVGELTQVEVREAEDSVMYSGDSPVNIALDEGDFLLLYPGEGHLPKLSLDGEAVAVNKFVFKIDIQS